MFCCSECNHFVGSLYAIVGWGGGTAGSSGGGTWSLGLRSESGLVGSSSYFFGSGLLTSLPFRRRVGVSIMVAMKESLSSSSSENMTV